MKRFIFLFLIPFLQATNSYFSVTVCASGCTYPATAVGLFNAIHFMATQQDSVSCIPGIIYITGTIQVNTGLDFPLKACAQYIELNGGSYHTPRFTIGTDDSTAAKFVVSVGGYAFTGANQTHYWRVRNVNFVSAALDTGVQASYTVSTASWTGGVVTYTIGTHLSSGTYSILGASNVQYNIGNAPLSSETTNTVSFAMTNNPGTWSGTATANLLFNYYSTGYIGWGSGFDQNLYPDHLEVIHCGMRAAGWAEIASALFLFGYHITVTDSYLSGFAKQGDSQAIQDFASDMVIRNTYLDADTETLGTGGSAIGAGYVPTHHVIKGNYFNKSPYIAYNYGSGVPTKPCFINTPYRDTVGNQDYICTVTTPTGTTTGTWALQTNLLNYGIGPYPYEWSANHIEYKTGQDVQMIGNYFGSIYGQSKQSSVALVLNVVSQPAGAWSSGLPYPITDLPQSWTTLNNFNIQYNHFDEGFSPLNLGYAVYTPCSLAKYNYGTTTWTITGNGTTTASGTGLPVGFVSGGNAGNMLVDGLVYPVASPVPGGGLSITFTSTLSAGTHTMILPCDDSHHHFNIANNLSTNMADERNYCASYNGFPCVHASDCTSNCGTTGFAFIDASDHDVIFDHNTALTSQFSTKSGATLYQGYNLNNTQDFSGVIALKNSIEPMGVNGYLSIPVNDGCGFVNLTSHFGGSSTMSKNILTLDPPSFQTWQSFATGAVTPGCTTPNIFPTDHAGGLSWSSVVSTSTFKVTNPTYQNWANDGRDPGADIDGVTLRSGNAMAGTYNPALETKIRSITSTATNGITIYATAYNTSSCTWELSTDPNAYSSPITVSSSTQTGRDIVAVWSSLSPLTTYFARMTCPSSPAIKVETFEDGNRVFFTTGIAATYPVSQYSMFNGTWHHETTLDAGCNASSGNPLLYHDSLVCNGGYLTDGVIGYSNPFAYIPLDQYPISGGSWDGTNIIFNIGPNDLTLTSACPALGNPPDWLSIQGTGSWGDNDIVYANIVNNSASVGYLFGHDPGTYTHVAPVPTVTRLLCQQAQTPNWIGWASDPQNPPQPTDTADNFATIVFKLNAQYTIHNVNIYVAKQSGLQIGCFCTAIIDFSNDGVTFANQFTYTSTTLDRTDRTAQWVTIPVTSAPPDSQYVRVHMTHIAGSGCGFTSGFTANDWIMVSEINFN